ncbi:MAG: phasin family protein [Xanthobacteraceae bacterium]|jgi:hypothetical protein
MANEKMTDWNVTLDQFVGLVREEMLKSVDKYLDFLQKTISSHPMGETELGGKAKVSAQKNIAIARDYAHKLSQAKDLLEVVPIQAEFMQSQLASFGEQIKSFGETYTQAATEVLNAPIRKVD